MLLTFYIIDENGNYPSFDGKIMYRKLVGREIYEYLHSKEAENKRFFIEENIGIEIPIDKEKEIRKHERRKQYVSDIEEENPYSTLSLHILIPDKEYTTEEVLADETVDVYKQVVQNIMKEDLYKAIESLTVVEKYIIECLYFKEPVKNQSEIAKELGVSQAIVSRKFNSAKKKLKRLMKEWF